MNIDGENLNHLSFADNVILIFKDKDELQDMLENLNFNSKQTGLKINMDKTAMCIPVLTYETEMWALNNVIITDYTLANERWKTGCWELATDG